MKYGIYFAYWEKEWETDYLPYLERVKRLGFDILEISCAALQNASHESLRELKEEALANGIILTAGYGPGPNENLASPDPAIVKHAISFYTDILKKLEYLDIHTIGGGIYSYWPVNYQLPIHKQKDWERSIKNVRTIGKIAETCGVDYCLEVLNRFEGYLLNTVWEAREFVQAVDVPAVKIMLDTFHMNIEEDSITVMEPFVMQGGSVGRDIRIWRDLSHNADERQLNEDAASSLSFLKHVFSGPYSDYTNH